MADLRLKSGSRVPPQADRATRHPLRALVIDNCSASRSTTELLLRDCGFQAGGSVACALAARKREILA